jgi:hypothetical protein
MAKTFAEIAEEQRSAERLQQQRDDRFARGQEHGTEQRPGERVESQGENFANIARAQQAQEEGTADQAIRWPWGATAASLGTGLAVTAITKNPLLGMYAATVSGGLGDLGQSGIETQLDLPTKPKSLDATIDSAKFEGLMSGVGEGVGRLPIQTAKAFRPQLFDFFKRQVTPDARKAMDFLKLEGAEEPLMLPARATENRYLDVAHNFAEHAIIGGGAIRNFNIRSQSFLEQLGDSYVNRIASVLEPEDVARGLVNAAKESKDLMQMPAQIAYNNLEAMTAPVVRMKPVKELVPPPGGVLDAAGNPVMVERVVEREVTEGGKKMTIRHLKDWLRPKAAEAKRLGPKSNLTTAGDTIDVFMGFPDKPFISDMIKQAQSLRVQKAVLKNDATTKNSPAIGMPSQIEKRLHGHINNALKQTDPALLKIKHDADAIYKQGAKQFNNRVIRGFASKLDFEKPGFAPEQVVETIFAPGHTARMRVVKKAVPPETWKKIAARGMKHVLEKSVDDATEQLNGLKLQKLLLGKANKGGLGSEGLVTAVGPIEAQRWIRFAQALKKQQAKVGATEGTMLVQLTQGGAIVTGLGGLADMAFGDTERGATIFAGSAGLLSLPFLAGRIMTNPTAANALIEGMTTPQTASASKISGIIGRLVQAVVPRQVETQPSRPTPLSQALSDSRTGLSALSGTPPRPANQP